MRSHFLSKVLCTFLLCFIMFSIESAQATNGPKLVLAPVWKAPGILSSIDKLTPNIRDADDDFRYIDVDLYATSSMEFWSVQITCTVTPTALVGFNNPDDNTAAGDGDLYNSIPSVVWGPEWGGAGVTYLDIVDPYNTVTGTRTFTVSRLGNATVPMGVPGVDHTFLLGTLRYRSKSTVNSPIDANLSCAGSAMARNGVILAPITYVAPTALKVSPGYRISGTVRYGGRPITANAGIGVSCEKPEGGHLVTTTSSTGDWFLMSRQAGVYKCIFNGNILNSIDSGYQPDRYLAAFTTFSLQSYEMRLRGVELLGGNFPTDQNTTPDEVVDLTDIAVITAAPNWFKPVTAGDVNGDGKTDKSDFTIATSNFGQTELVDARRVLYSVPRNGQSWQEGQIWIGRPDAGDVALAVKNQTQSSRDLWAAFSPGNVSIAYVHDVSTNNDGQITHTSQLYVGEFLYENTAAKALTAANSGYQAFAPSWSPDGNRIAFICSTYDPGNANTVVHGYLADEGHLCLIDANGKNFVDLTPDATPVKARIYPPAWLSNDEIVFGGASVTDSVCDGTLCHINLLNHNISVFDADVATCSVGVSAQLVDMPVIRSGNLIYRAVCGGASRLRWARLNFQNDPDFIDPYEALPGTAPWTHTDVTTPQGYLVLNVDYFNVSQYGLDLMFNYPGNQNFTFGNASLTGDSINTPYRWNFSPTGHAVNGMMPNPAAPVTPFDFTDVNDPSWLYAYRSTIDWQP